MTNEFPTEFEFQRAFVEYLKKTGFPDESIILEPRIVNQEDGNTLMPDILVIDIQTKEIVLLLELKQRKRLNLDSDSDRLSKELLATGNPLVKGYLITNATGAAEFEIYKLDENSRPIKTSLDVLNYESLTGNFAAQKIDELKKSKDTTDKIFRTLCVSLALAALLLVVADFYFLISCNVTVLTTERIVILGFASFCFLLPYFQKIKALGIELERNRKDKK